MAEKKCCGNCYYGKINNIGIQCAICMLKSNICEDKLELHGKNDRCEEWLARTDEYISRKEVLTITMKYCPDDDGSCTESDVDMRDMLDEIEELEAADVQPVKHGRWIEQRHTPTNGYNYNVPYNTYVCSSCGLEIHNDEYSKYVRGTYTNCPVCTARMDGGADNENS